MQHKQTVVKTLFHRALRISSPARLQEELELIKNALKKNGYPEQFIRYHSKIALRPKSLSTVEKKRLSISLPYKGMIPFQQLQRHLSAAIKKTFNAAKVIVTAQTRQLPIPPIKQKLPTSSTSHCLYKFQCSCDCSYLGRTDRALGHRILEHFPN